MGMVLGADIGYSNLKLAFGAADQDHPFLEILPAMAVPESLFAGSMFGASDADESEGVRVLVNGQPWIAGIPDSKLQRRVPREIHDGYVGSDMWMALAYAGMLLPGASDIDMMIVGLPVHHYEDQGRRDRLRELLQRTHQVTAKRRVHVERVVVVPQPVGGYIEALYGKWCHTNDKERIVEESVLTIDPGYFSMDWTLIRPGGRYAGAASSSSLSAMSRMIEVCRKRIAQDYGSAPSASQMEEAIRQQKSSIYVFQESVDLLLYLREAAKTVATESMKEMRESMRLVDDQINHVLLAGGGADLYLEAAKAVYPKSRFLVSDRPEMANAAGFWYLHKQVLG